jgi:catechol 2,3-dioxygenase-like lactoylglutathione lyase family enzyme
MKRDRPKLDQINIVSGNPEASIAFYRRLGLEIAERSIWRTASGIHHVTASGVMGLDIDSIAFAQRWNIGWHGRQDLKGRVVVGFSLPSRGAVDAAYGNLTAAGHVGLQEPYDAIWGARYAVVEDPDGIAVGLMSPVSPDHRSPPPKI